MAEDFEEQQHQNGGEEEHPSPEMNGSADAVKPIPPAENGHVALLCIWPPSQRTRDAVIRRLVETLSSPSVLSNRYGLVSHEEASAAASLIEQAAFSAASACASAAENGHAGSIDGGIEILHIYSKEVSQRMLEFGKGRSGPASAPSSVDSNGTVEMTTPIAPSSATDEVSFVESEAPAS